MSDIVRIYKFSDESRARMSQAQTGKTITDAQRSGLALGAQARLGSKASAETRQKLSDSHLGQRSSLEQRQKHSKFMKRYWAERRAAKVGDLSSAI